MNEHFEKIKKDLEEQLQHLKDVKNKISELNLDEKVKTELIKDQEKSINFMNEQIEKLKNIFK